MGILGKIFSKGAPDLVDSVGSIVDNIVTTDEEKLTAKNKLTDLLTRFVISYQELQAKVLVVEMSGNWLQRSWRPILMLVFAGIVVSGTIWDINLKDSIPQTSPFWGLLKIGIGGYVGGRTVEKVAKNISENMDISFKKKKNR